MGKRKFSSLTEKTVWLKCSLFLCFLLLGIASASAQTKTITGIVKDGTNEPLLGVTVKIVGSTTGTITDVDGKYSLSAKAGDKLMFTYLGMTPKTITVNSANTINVAMQDDATMLEATVVIGYGSAKAKDLTSSIPTLKGDVLEKNLTASPMQGLQGKIAGLQVVNAGQPGASPSVRIRGVATYNQDADGKIKAGPLYVVDGMFFDNIDFLSNSDIESMSVMKDASSCAIYGVRAANGVIIITTKKGLPNQKATITYDGYVGVQKASNLVKMANTAQYTQMIKETGDIDMMKQVNQSIALYGGANGVPTVNTDWYKELLKPALMQSHSLNVRGGSKTTTYSISGSYLDQKGVLNSNNDFQRVNSRVKVDTKLAKWLKIGGNIGVVNSSQVLGNDIAFDNAFMTPTMVPVYDPKNTVASPIDYASPSQIGLSTTYANPVATAHYYDKTKKIFQVLPSFYAQVSLLNDKLTLRSSFTQDISLARTADYTPQFTVGGNQNTATSTLQKTDDYFNNWIADNVATYQDKVGNNNFTIMAGNSVRDSRWQMLQATANGVPGGKDEYHYIDNGTADSRTSTDGGNDYRGVSYFGRALYNYADKYLLSATMRADGSSKFQKKWGYFPSVGLGWVISREGFMANQKVFSFLKVRANWGELGNDGNPASDGFSSVTRSLATSGVFNDAVVDGATYLSFASTLQWEVEKEADLGLDFTILKNRLTGTFDWYKRTTTNAIFKRQYAFGSDALLMNNGEIQNSGIELTLNWNDKIGKDFAYNIGFNMSTLKNEVTKLDGLDYINTGTAEYRTVRMIGQPVDSYYGYKVIGVYQNQAQIDADPLAVANGLKPGDLMYQHADPKSLTPSDRQILGSSIPNFFLGGNLGFNFKNWDFNLAYQGQFGAKIINVKRFQRRLMSDMNYDQDLVKNHWTGEGSTNTYPSAAALSDTWTESNNLTSFMVESGNTFTIQNIQLGYTFANILKGKDKASLRLSLTAQRPFSFFSYNGFTTDIQNGLDQNTYPLASTYSFGIKLIY